MGLRIEDWMKGRVIDRWMKGRVDRRIDVLHWLPAEQRIS